MPLALTADLMADATANNRAIAAFNVITLEHAQGIARGAERAGLPTILQLSENAIKYHGSPYAIASAIAEVARASSAQISLHLDHITDPDLVRLAPELRASSVMFDGAHHDYANNVRMTREAVLWSRNHNIWVEAELGEIGGKDGAHAPGVRTSPVEALQFVTDTEVAALAVAVGSSHAMTSKTASLDHQLISQLSAALPVPLVLHGSSGVSDSELAKAVSEGMTKINIGTALNIEYTSAVREFLDANSSATDPRKYAGLAREAVAELAQHSLEVLARSVRI